jgi:hypothetical protein
LELEFPPAARDLHHDVSPEDIGGHQVGRELDPIKRKVQHFTQRADQERFAEARHAFEQDMTAGKQGDKSPFHDGIVAHDDFPDFGPQGRVRFAKRSNLLVGVHFFRSSK